ncbi:MAG TPA: undecaprenyldiphospho-muramoylpentapeptide beta-N-acetylglucosaminyltransferase [Propionibacteriaceae bacterium]|nr:undecaprenyldiphospho-muramoylpentapeptide beta-N-acetylglucosaminyltransferase [Propionibacteriaceae bacterium]HBY23061.1 undecaprenyldiphospho-muramoylpentapeptide beta-N-acetylglucosaminyltransferase [Propionibacteriaceae bacterium]
MTSVVLAGGGTAGHTSPLIATAQALQVAEPNVTLLAIGTPKGLESRVVPAAGLELAMIPPVPLPRKITPELFKVPGRLVGAVREARRILTAANADVVVGFGGYVSMPVYLAARAAKVPIVIHEQNAVPGLANKVAARLTHSVGVSFPGTPLPHATLVGLPVRAAIATLDRAAARPAARAAFGLPAEGPVLLVSGGSQGARSINQAVEGALREIIAAGVSVLHVLGPKNITSAHEPRTDASGAVYLPLGYVDEMADAYAAADLMLARAGAGTVAETATVGLPTVFVPLPHGNGEQAKNAEGLVAAGAGVVVLDGLLTSDWLVATGLPLVLDAKRLATMGERLRGLMPADAAGRVAAMVLGAVKR